MRLGLVYFEQQTKRPRQDILNILCRSATEIIKYKTGRENCLRGYDQFELGAL